MNSIFKIADVYFEVVLPSNLHLVDLLDSFTPFVINDSDLHTVDLRVEVSFDGQQSDTSSLQLLSDISVEWGNRFKLFEDQDDYLVVVESELQDAHWELRCERDFGRAKIIVQESLFHAELGILSWMLMVVFGQGAIRHDTIMVHASTVITEGVGYAFLGKSGTGKSTHSQLWVAHIPQTQLLNDDNPAIRMDNSGTVNIFGTPWSGKTACYKNEQAPLGGLVRLQQASDNAFRHKSDSSALLDVLPSCTALRWNKRLFNQMVSNLIGMLQEVPVGFLECRPDAEAALLSFNSIKHPKNCNEIL